MQLKLLAASRGACSTDRHPPHPFLVCGEIFTQANARQRGRLPRANETF
jgi:hypothetical protein